MITDFRNIIRSTLDIIQLIVRTRNMKLISYNGASHVVNPINEVYAISDMIDSHGRPVHPDADDAHLMMINCECLKQQWVLIFVAYFI